MSDKVDDALILFQGSVLSLGLLLDKNLRLENVSAKIGKYFGAL